MTTSNETQRLFFALWPDEAVLESVTSLFAGPLKSIHGRKVQLHNLHITLAFLGNIDTQTHNCMQQAAGQVQGDAFVLQLSQLGYWPKPKVVWLGTTSVPNELVALQQQLVQALQSCGFEAEERPFHLHLTLLRKVQHGIPLTDIDSIAWPVRDFVLVHSNTLSTGVEYEVIAHWPLGKN